MKNVLLLTIGTFALGFDAYVIAGLLPEISTTFNITDSQGGQSVTVFTLCYALAAPIFATLVAGKSIRIILVIALAVFSIANGASALVTNFSLFLIARAMAGIGAGLFSPLASVAASSLVSEQKRGRALGLTLGGLSMGTALGVPLGLIIAEQIGWKGTLWVIAIIGLMAMIGILFFFPNLSAETPPSLRHRIAMIANKHVLAIVGITFLTSIASIGLYTYIASILQSIKGIHLITPYVWAWGIGGVVGSFSIGPLIDRTGRPALLTAGLLAVLALVMISLPFIFHFPVFVFILIFLWGVMAWAFQAPQQHRLIQLQSNHAEAVVALNSSANYLGGAVGSMIGGVALFAGLSSSQLPIASGCLLFIAFLGQLLIMLSNNKVRKLKIG
ncbi:MFS transporter [Neobacillus novalis]|uniref:MFS transporter n=1 Tax=Neobacillus novalis TaxID=220687 RepID=A0AA95MQV0_9BACI|nr:MFS transporter [Neobacillus novalis]WHY88627.1 MFS transporter [Neobacillus novalis]